MLLNKKLSSRPNLLNVTHDVYDSLRSSLNYSSQALPVNALLDTLLRPKGDTSLDSASCIEWRFEPDKAVKHVVLGNAPAAGGQWADNAVSASWDIGTLSYAEQLSLPGYTLSDHWLKVKGQKLPELIRPSRRDVAQYLATYPAAVGIQDSFHNSTNVGTVIRTRTSFHIAPQNINCRHLALASGIFNINLPPPSFIRGLGVASDVEHPLLVIGSGFTAADIIISTPPTRKIIHIYNWEPNKRPSPLKACHASAYPDYAWIYTQMRIASERTIQRSYGSVQQGPKKPPSDAAESIRKRDWSATYEGYSNARVLASSFDPDFRGGATNSFGGRKGSGPDLSRTVNVDIGRSSIGDTIRRTIGGFRYATGRRGSLSYLSQPLFREVIPENPFVRPSAPPSAPASSRGSIDSDRPFTNHPLDTQNPASRLQASDGRRSSMGGPNALPAAKRGNITPARQRAASTVASIQGNFLPDEETPPQLLRSDVLTQLRRGSADFDFALAEKPTLMISGQTLRHKVEEGQEDGLTDLQDHTQGFEVAHNVFVVGSLSGDSLIRHAFGGCTVVAGKVMRDRGLLEPLPTVSGAAESRVDGQRNSVDASSGVTPIFNNFSFGGDNTNTAPGIATNGAAPANGQRSMFGNYSMNQDIDPRHKEHMHLQGQDHAAMEQDGSTWMARRSKRGSVSSNTSAGSREGSVARKGSLIAGQREERRGSLLGRLKDKIKG